MNTNIIKQTKLKHLEKLTVLGEGQFGEVWHVQTKNIVYRSAGKTGTTTVKQTGIYDYALKIQQKQDDIRWEEAEILIKREIESIRVLGSERYPFICELVHTYEDDATIQILMKLITGGGELRYLMVNENGLGDSSRNVTSANADATPKKQPILTFEQTKFYTYVIADTLRYIHSKNYVYRDLKPENIMIDKYGYPIMIDFGFAKHIELMKGDLTYTFCGTPEYAAPEILMQEGHNHAVDYWSLGVLLYEMLTKGKEHPFYYDGIDQRELYQVICYESYEPFSQEFKKDIKDVEAIQLVEQLLMKDPLTRLGTSAKEVVTNDKWFHNYHDIQLIHQRKIRAPWIPNRSTANTKPTKSMSFLSTTVPATSSPSPKKKVQVEKAATSAVAAADVPSSSPSTALPSSLPLVSGSEEDKDRKENVKPPKTSKTTSSPSTSIKKSTTSSTTSSITNDKTMTTSSPQTPKSRKRGTWSPKTKAKQNTNTTLSSPSTPRTNRVVSASSPKSPSPRKSSPGKISTKEARATSSTGSPKKEEDKKKLKSPNSSPKKKKVKKEHPASAALKLSKESDDVLDEMKVSSHNNNNNQPKRKKKKQRSTSSPAILPTSDGAEHTGRPRNIKKLVIPAAFQSTTSVLPKQNTFKNTNYSYRKKLNDAKKVRHTTVSAAATTPPKEDPVTATPTKKKMTKQQQESEEQPSKTPHKVSPGQNKNKKEPAVEESQKSMERNKEESATMTSPTTMKKTPQQPSTSRRRSISKNDADKEDKQQQDEEPPQQERRRSSKKIKIPSAFKRSSESKSTTTKPAIVSPPKKDKKKTKVRTSRSAAKDEDVAPTVKVPVTPVKKEDKKGTVKSTKKNLDVLPTSTSSPSSTTVDTADGNRDHTTTKKKIVTVDAAPTSSMETKKKSIKGKYSPSYSSSQQLLNNSNHKRSEQQKTRRGNKLVIPAAFRSRE